MSTRRRGLAARLTGQPVDYDPAALYRPAAEVVPVGAEVVDAEIVPDSPTAEVAVPAPASPIPAPVPTGGMHRLDDHTVVVRRGAPAPTVYGNHVTVIHAARVRLGGNRTTNHTRVTGRGAVGHVGGGVEHYHRRANVRRGGVSARPLLLLIAMTTLAALYLYLSVRY